MPSEDSKPIKKEDFDDDDDDNKSLGSILRDKSKKKTPSSSNVSASKLSKPKKEEISSPQKKPISKPVKKLEPPSSDSDDNKPILKKPLPKDDNKANSIAKNKKKEEVKKKVGEVKKKVEEVVTKKRERKVFALPGQKRDPPEERDPLRIFYESLYEQVSDSEMAAIWMMESGLLPADVAKIVQERKQKRGQLQKMGSPMKSVSTTKRAVQSKSATVKMVKDPSSNSSTKKNMKTTVTSVKPKKRKKDESSEDEDSGDDFIISKAVKKRKA